jgi:chorismate synthase
VVCEGVLALVLADAVLEMFGGDTLGDVEERLQMYLARVAERAPRG